jgi:DNA transformation protein and related proteins
MAEIKGDRLYVNLGASQTRRRLLGHGFGMKKVQTVGRNQAVIIHTATGRHRDELHALFSDVISSESMAVPEG